MKKRWLIVWVAAFGVLLWQGKALVWLAARQLFLGMLAALAALPLMKRLEKRLPSGWSAAIAITAVNAAMAALIVLFVPVVTEQGKQLIALLPGLWENAAKAGSAGLNWLSQHGLRVDTQVQTSLLARGQEALGAVIPALFSRIGDAAGNVGQWLLAPVFGFYFLRDRRELSAWLLLLLPVNWRGISVDMLREIRRETTGYLRGQLLLCASVAGLTGAGLLLCGVPSWFALGILMGVLELIPYVGPVIGAALAALFALPLGWWRMLWAVGVTVLVQQLEGSVLSPKFISQTTRLHPAAVILCTVLGGAAAGMTGVLLAVPLVLCVRAALRVLVLRRL